MKSSIHFILLGFMGGIKSGHNLLNTEKHCHLYHSIYVCVITWCIWLKYLGIYSIYVSLMRQGFRAFLGKSWAKVSCTPKRLASPTPMVSRVSLIQHWTNWFAPIATVTIILTESIFFLSKNEQAVHRNCIFSESYFAIAHPGRTFRVHH